LRQTNPSTSALGWLWARNCSVKRSEALSILPNGAIFAAHKRVLSNEHNWLCAFTQRCCSVYPLIDDHVTAHTGAIARCLQCRNPRSSSFFSLSREAHDRLREWATGDETATVFVAPWILQVYDAVKSGTLGMPKTGHPLSRDFEWRYGIPEPALEHAQNALQNRFSLYALAEACVIWEAELRRRIDEIQRQIDDEVFHLYEISDEDRAIIEA
jgi:hypothetical protein